MKTTKEKMIAEIVKAQNGKTVTVKFLKRSTHKLRVMKCKMGEVRYLKGGILNYKPSDYALLPVFETKFRSDKGYKCISLEGVREIRTANSVHKFAATK